MGTEIAGFNFPKIPTIPEMQKAVSDTFNEKVVAPVKKGYNENIAKPVNNLFGSPVLRVDGAATKDAVRNAADAFLSQISGGKISNVGQLAEFDGSNKSANQLRSRLNKFLGSSNSIGITDWKQLLTPPESQRLTRVLSGNAGKKTAPPSNPTLTQQVRDMGIPIPTKKQVVKSIEGAYNSSARGVNNFARQPLFQVSGAANQQAVRAAADTKLSQWSGGNITSVGQLAQFDGSNKAANQLRAKLNQFLPSSNSLGITDWKQLLTPAEGERLTVIKAAAESKKADSIQTKTAPKEVGTNERYVTTKDGVRLRLLDFPNGVQVSGPFVKTRMLASGTSNEAISQSDYFKPTNTKSASRLTVGGTAFEIKRQSGGARNFVTEIQMADGTARTVTAGSVNQLKGKLERAQKGNIEALSPPRPPTATFSQKVNFGGSKAMAEVLKVPAAGLAIFGINGPKEALKNAEWDLDRQGRELGINENSAYVRAGGLLVNAPFAFAGGAGAAATKLPAAGKAILTFGVMPAVSRTGQDSFDGRLGSDTIKGIGTDIATGLVTGKLGGASMVRQVAASTAVQTGTKIVSGQKVGAFDVAESAILNTAGAFGSKSIPTKAAGSQNRASTEAPGNSRSQKIQSSGKPVKGADPFDAVGKSVEAFKKQPGQQTADNVNAARRNLNVYRDEMRAKGTWSNADQARFKAVLLKYSEADGIAAKYQSGVNQSNTAERKSPPLAQAVKSDKPNKPVKAPAQKATAPNETVSSAKAKAPQLGFGSPDAWNGSQKTLPASNYEAKVTLGPSGEVLGRFQKGNNGSITVTKTDESGKQKVFSAGRPERGVVMQNKNPSTNYIFTGDGNWHTLNSKKGGGSEITKFSSERNNPTYKGPIKPEINYKDFYPADIHVHQGGKNGGSYGENFRGNDLSELLDLTRDPKNPLHGYALAVQRVPQSSPAGTRYYLASQRDGSVISVDVRQKVNKNTGVTELIIDPVKNLKGEVIFKGGTYNRSQIEGSTEKIKNDRGLMVPVLQLPNNQTIVPASFIPDLRLRYAGLERDKELMTQIVQNLKPEDQSRVYAALTSGDPGSMLNDKQINEALRFANEIDPSGKKLRMIFGETTLAKEGVITNLNGAPDLTQPAPIHNLLNFVDKVKGVIVFHVDSGTPAMLNTAKGDFTKAILGSPSNYANVNKALDIFAQHPDSNIIWAHAAGVGRFNLPANDHNIRTMQRVLEGPDSYKLKHINFDLSWDVVIKNLGDKGLLPELADLVNRHPERFLYGSDSVGAGNKKDGTPDYKKYAATMDQMVKSGFLGRLNHPDLFLRGNFDRLVIPATERLNQYRSQNRELINNYPK